MRDGPGPVMEVISWGWGRLFLVRVCGNLWLFSENVQRMAGDAQHIFPLAGGKVIG